MNDSRFDAFTKALATPTSRRTALRRIGGAITGAILASWPFGHTLASNSACAHFCNAVFGADTPAAKQCISDAAHGKGLCHQCGSATPSSICCSRNSSGYCSSYSGAHCPCNATQCQKCDATAGTCVSSCASGQVCLSNGSCATPCSSGCPSDCDCASGISLGTSYCFSFGSQGPNCTTDSDCPAGKFCNFAGHCTFLCTT